MAYVQPSGTIQLFRGINLDNRYMHTLYFANSEAQNNFFTALVDPALQFTNQYYSRPSRGRVRVKINAENCQDVTYMRFNNRGNMWYYCFVTSTNYINENVTDIYYEIDVMQTWFVKNNNPIKPCRVLRHHVAPNDDVFTRYLEPEPVGSEIYDFTKIENASDATTGTSIDTYFNGSSVVVAVSSEPDADKILMDGIVVGTAFRVYDPHESAVALINNMETLLGSWDKNEQSADVVDMFMFPKYFAGAMDDNGSYYVDSPHRNQATINIDHPKKYSNYVPQNKKLFGYPFAYLYVTSKDGDAGEYRWEYFEGDVTEYPATSHVQFELNACCTGGGSMEVHPKSYNGMEHNYDSRVSITNFPKCSWAYDAYQAFVASGNQSKLYYQANMAEKKGLNAKRQNYVQSAQQTMNNAVNAYEAIESKNIGGSIKGVTNTAASATMGYLKDEEIELGLNEARHKVSFEFADAMYVPDIVVGASVPNISMGAGYMGFEFYHAHVRDDEMVKIDNFLSVFGYAINNVVTPILTGRPHWNFVKTQDAVIGGNMPATSKTAIAEIFNGGIFFWNSNGTPATVNNNIGNFTIQTNNHGQIINKP